jgi:hypothetical protein
MERPASRHPLIFKPKTRFIREYIVLPDRYRPLRGDGTEAF